MLLLAACSSEPTGTAPDQLLGQVASNILPRNGPAPGARDISELTRSAIAGVTEPLTLITVPDVNVATTVVLAARKGNVETWRAADGGSLLLDGPVLFATRGIGQDLLAAETSGLRQMLQAGRSGTLTRDLRHLDGLDQIRITHFQCTLARDGAERIVILDRPHDVTRFRETCRAGELEINNTYWLDRGGFAWKSRQWVGQALGYMVIERLVR